jgi:GTP:adenosylcobinamide-phosphate guanylyltransferase
MTEQAEQIPAALLAGGGADDKVAAAAGAPCKALAEVAGRPLIAWVLDALNAAEKVSEIVVAQGPTEPLRGRLGDEIRVVTARGPDFLDTLMAAAEALGDAERMLLATADLPLLTPQALDELLGACLQSQAEVSYAIVAAEEVRRELPGRGKTVARLREGQFVSGNLVCASRRFLLEHKPVITRIFAARKNPLAMLRMFGWRFVLRLLRGSLSIADLERRASEMLGTTLEAVRCQHTELAFDVDKPKDLALAEELMARRGGAGA